LTVSSARSSTMIRSTRGGETPSKEDIFHGNG
jgi:hypothetical protein